MSIIKSALPWLLAIFITAGCAAQKPEEEHNLPSASSSGQVAVSSFEATDAPIPKSAFNRMIGDTLYYLESKWDEDSRKLMDSSIWRLQRMKAEPEPLTDFGDAELLLFFTDEQEAVYCLYALPGENGGAEDYFFRKLTPEGKIVYDTAVNYQGTPGGQGVLSRFGTVSEGEADMEGRSCLAGTQGDLYLFDADGQLVRIAAAPWTADTYNGSSCGLVNAGADGIYICQINDRKLSLQKVDMTDGTLSTAIEVPTADMADASLELYNGYSRGLLISDSNALWKYNISDRTLTRLLGWGDSTVDLKSHIINAIGILADGSLYVAAHPPGQDIELVSIASQDASQLPEKQTAVLARVKMFEDMQSALEKAVSQYNRESTEYQVELHSYASLFDLETALLKGEGPDLFSLGDFGLDIHSLTPVLEDLSPYFAESRLVTKEDLLPVILEAGTIDDKFLCVIPSFAVYGTLVGKGVTEAGLWTSEDYVALGEEHPDIPLESSTNPEYYRNSVLQSAIKGDMEHYVDWKERKCRFNSESFVSLLDRISRLPLHGNTDPNYNGGMNARIDRVSNGQELTTFWSVENNSALKSYLDIIDSGASLELAGYPCQGTEPYYELFSPIPLGMNCASQNKEAAWSFLEFLLSEYQDSLDGAIPARQDAFDSFLNRENGPYGQDWHISEETKTLFRDIVAHAHWTAASNTSDILYIISEEAAAVWAGDKTAGQAAEIIQNRVTLFLNE